MAMTALAIDSLLPAFDDIRARYGLASDATEVSLLVMAFILGLGVGQLPAGLLADRYGRRQVLWAGVAVYIAGAVAALLAPTLWWMIAARFLWGVGTAGPRVAVTAIVRDSYEGDAMARQMSTIMAVFLMVPMVAPSIGAGLNALGPWQLTIWLCIALAALIFTLSQFLPATMPAGTRQQLSAHDVWASWKVVVTTPGTIGYTLAVVLMTASFISYIASSENIVDEVFGLKTWFAAIFGVSSLGLALANLANGRIVGALGLRRLLTVVPVAQVAVTAAMLVVALATGGTPPFALFLPLIMLTLMTQQVTMVNANSAAMLPLGKVAGSGAAIIGAAPQVFGALAGSQIDAQFDGTVTPLAIAFLVTAALAWASIRHALHTTR